MFVPNVTGRQMFFILSALCNVLWCECKSKMQGLLRSGALSTPLGQASVVPHLYASAPSALIALRDDGACADRLACVCTCAQRSLTLLSYRALPRRSIWPVPLALTMMASITKVESTKISCSISSCQLSWCACVSLVSGQLCTAGVHMAIHQDTSLA